MFTVQYNGYVYIKGEGDTAPKLDDVRQAAKLLLKPKKAQDIHPLFARGFDTPLLLKIMEEGLRVYVVDDAQREMVVMDHPVHRISFVKSDEKNVHVVCSHALRNKGSMLKCHGFRLASKDEAKLLVAAISSCCASLNTKLKTAQKFVRSRQSRASTVRDKPVEQSTSGVPMRATRRQKDHADTQELRRLIASTRLSITEGSADECDIPDDVFEKTITMCDDTLSAEEMRTIQEEVKTAVGPLEIASLDEEREDKLHFEWEDEFDDDFARMTLFVYGDSANLAVPHYADITLDSAIFNCSDV